MLYKLVFAFVWLWPEHWTYQVLEKSGNLKSAFYSVLIFCFFIYKDL